MAFTYDTRYVFNNVHFGEPTQYTVQEQSGVFDTLVNMPLYDTLIGTADQAKAFKQNVRLNYASKTNILWDPECPIKGLTRQEIYEDLSYF